MMTAVNLLYRLGQRFILLFLLISSCVGNKTDLNGEWEFFVSGQPERWKGIVPGDVYSDLHRIGAIPDPLKDENAINTSWVGWTNWNYVKHFTLGHDVLLNNNHILVLHGVDTIANVVFNNITILSCKNQFLRYTVDVSKLVQENNTIEIQFQSPVFYAHGKAEEYRNVTGHGIPPRCPPEVQHGECHPNFIRKAQYSFSWDWGPSIPTSGLWKPVELISLNQAQIDTVSWVTLRTESDWEVQGTISFLKPLQQSKLTCEITIDNLPTNTSIHISLKKKKNFKDGQDFKLKISRDKVKVWWPHGEGDQRVYKLHVKCGNSERLEIIAFKHVELIQDYVDPRFPTKGRDFYFKINDRPIFLKGSNWIPASMFLGSDHKERVEFLLDSAVEAGMNALRVWGGGVYETEEFYQYATKKGLLIWQDLMFACALYPTNQEFLSNVREEVRQQVTRLRKHASILLFAGNNENEIAISTHWWAEENYPESHMIIDYLKLYQTTITPLMKELDPSREYLMSSPSNGVESLEEGGVSKNPGNPRYGDIHFYSEVMDLWTDNNYQTPRCATEYGTQSYPDKSTLLHYINSSSFTYFNPNMVHRQHHMGGILTLIFMIMQHFPIAMQPKECTANSLDKCDFGRFDFLDRFLFYTQAHQAITYKAQTEHYRRYRNLLTEDGFGNTMCALYWQLNDVWAAPTWSSIDYDLQWKPVHYEAKRFFAPLAVILYYSGEDNLGVTVVNDFPATRANLTVRILQFTWTNGFEPVFKDQKVATAPKLTAKEIDFGSAFIRQGKYDNDYFFVGQLLNSSGAKVAPDTVLLPDRMSGMNYYIFGNITIAEFKKIDKLTYEITLETATISPFTWISLNKKNILHWWSDNSFLMFEPRKTVQLKLRTAADIDISDISICNLKTCGNSYE